MTGGSPSAADTGRRLVEALTAAGETLACAESLTAGLVAATVADTPGASRVLRGGVVAYAADVKASVLGVPTDLLERVGTVDADVAAAMAEGVRRVLDATWGLATTGVAGPGPAEGKPAGTVHVAVAGPSGIATRLLRLDGSRSQVRAATVAAVLELALARSRAVRGTTTPRSDPRGTVWGPGRDGAPGT